MGYKNPTYDIVTAWFNELDGAISVPVYKEMAPNGTTGNYVIIRPESQTTSKNKGMFISTVVIIVEVVTEHKVTVNTKTVNDIDEEITEIIFPTPSTHAISLTDHKVSTINLQTATYLLEDADKLYYSKISRYEHFLNQ
jgi:hypothetical protein